MLFLKRSSLFLESGKQYGQPVVPYTKAVVVVLAFYSDDLSSNPNIVYNF